jgi:chromosome segregation ATPase
VQSVQDGVEEIKKGKEALEREGKINDILSVSAETDVLSRAKDVVQMLSALKMAAGCTDADKIGQNRADYEISLTLLNSKDNLKDAIQTLLDNLNDASKFVTQMVSSITGMPIQSKPVFPMEQGKKEQILSVLKKASAEARADHSIVSSLLQQANSVGYDGSDAAEAVSYIVDFYSSKEKKSALDEMNRQLNELRAALDAEVNAHKQDIEKKAKEIAECRNATIQLSQKFKAEREELWNNNTQMESRIRQLADDLNNEKSLRRELSRVGAGMSADKKLLKSKLSAQEFKLLELVEKLVQSEKQTRRLHETTKRARQEILGNINQ